jgi:AcrR family transcriptional regulator
MAEKQDKRRLRGERVRNTILATAADIASAEGLEGLSIGRLASETKTSKSNIAAHFGTKAALQMAVIGYAGSVFTREVVSPSLEVDEGLDRLMMLYRRWMDYSRRRVFRGGCFFAAVNAEYDAQDGPVRDVLRERRNNWLALQESIVAQARERGELREDIEPQQLAFELDAYALAANTNAVLFDDDKAYDRAWSAIAARIRAAAQSQRRRERRTTS